ncbi:hypothetical protein EXIGLDRAFT_719917 [Exidia glandulosa HHB12029]|uniref:Uncharacterized protein n=1 Tax=Exidia glandulosa HHB12029 TaxID=1314781 RepID=A0A165GNV5_EXIGL|nr:hypothetical protein EXIGLDRAFT_719917 [Exidia glandulosa HHB12029]
MPKVYWLALGRHGVVAGSWPPRTRMKLHKDSCAGRRTKQDHQQSRRILAFLLHWEFAMLDGFHSSVNQHRNDQSLRVKDRVVFRHGQGTVESITQGVGGYVLTIKIGDKLIERVPLQSVRKATK